MEINKIILSIIIIVCLTVPIFLIKAFNANNNYTFILIASIFNIIMFFAYSQLLRDTAIYLLFPLWMISSIIVLIAGVFVYHEPMKPINCIGIIVGIVAMFLIAK